MAINTISTASKYAGELDKIFVNKSVVGFFADNILRAKFVGAATVMLPDIDFVGLGDYDRDDGFPKGAVTVAHTAYALAKDRGRSFQIDREDMDETGVMNLAGQVLSEFVRTKVVPESDAYCLSKIYGVANTKSHVTAYDGTAALEQLLGLINNVRNSAGYDEELVCFVDSTMMAALEIDPLISRQIIVTDFKKGDVNLKVKSLNGCAIIPVPDERMKTSYVFDAGEDTDEGGFVGALGAGTIQAICMPKAGASLVKKHEELRVFAPEKNINADAYKFDYRLHYDIFVKKSHLNDIYALSTMPTPTPNPDDLENHELNVEQ